MTLNILLLTVSVLVLGYLLSKRNRKKPVVLSELSKKELDLNYSKSERIEYTLFITNIAKSVSAVLNSTSRKESWEKDFCNSILKNASEITNIRNVDVPSHFSHSINILRGNALNVENDYLGSEFVKGLPISHSRIKSCLNGDLDSLMLMLECISLNNRQYNVQQRTA
jgi:hypothetical protein